MKTNRILQNIKNILISILLIICILMVTIVISIIIKSNKNKEKVPDILGIKPMIVLSGTMETEIYTGDMAIIKEINTKELKQGDIIAFKNSENIILTHRITKIEEKNGNLEFVTKGDNNDTNDDGTIKENQIEGKYIFKIPGLGKLMMYLQKPQALLMIIIIILLFGMIWIYVGDRKEINK